VGTLFNHTHSISIKQPVAPQSMKACVHCLTTMSVNLISMLTLIWGWALLHMYGVIDAPRPEGNCVNWEWGVGRWFV
jgi:hypothetical protein